MTEKENGYARFQVKGAGLTMQFGEHAEAKKQFESLKRKSIKNQIPFSLELNGKKKSGSWELIDEAKVTEKFYENEA